VARCNGEGTGGDEDSPEEHFIDSQEQAFIFLKNSHRGIPEQKIRQKAAGKHFSLPLNAEASKLHISGVTHS